MFLLLALTATYINNGPSAVMAFQTPSPRQHGGHSNNNNNNHKHHGRQQQNNNPVKARTFEPRTTEFPKTSTPADGNDRKSGMFSPMDENEPRRKKRKQQQTQKVIKSIWDSSAPILVGASSLNTVDFAEASVERVQVLLKKSDMDPFNGKRTNNREPLIARVDLWHGPDSTPQNLAIYLEDEEDEEFWYHDDDDHIHGESHPTSSGGCDTPFSTIIETPNGHNTIAIRNIAESSDLLTCVEGEENKNWYKPSAPHNDSPLQSVIQRLEATTTPQRIDSTTARKSETYDDDEESNKAVVGSCTVELPSKVASVQVLLQTDFMQPIQARIELELRMMDDDSSNPSTKYRVVKRTIVEVYSEDGMHRPFFAILETPRKNNRRSRVRQQKGGDAEQQGWFGNNNNGTAVSYSTSMKVVNLSTTEFPLFATVEPHSIDKSIKDDNRDETGKSSSSSRRPGSEVQDDSRQEWTHFGGGSNYDIKSNSTILDAEIL